MIYIGCHLSVTDGYEAMGKTMSRFGGSTFAWFMRNPRGGRTKPVVLEDVEALLLHLEKQGFGPLVAHGSYTMNLCSAKVAEKSLHRVTLERSGGSRWLRK
jgi:deoxyribonuclease-4